MSALGYDEQYRCQALTTSTGERCKRRAHPGATVCVKHGAGAPQVKAKAKQRLAQQRVEHELGRMLEDLEGETLSDGSPLEVLHDAIVRCDAMVQVLGVLVGQLRPEQGDWSKPGRLMGLNHLGDGAPHVAVEMYRQWIHEAGRLSKLAIDAGLEERLEKMSERQAGRIVEFTEALLVALGHRLSDPRVEAALRRCLPILDGELALPETHPRVRAGLDRPARKVTG